MFFSYLYYGFGIIALLVSTAHIVHADKIRAFNKNRKANNTATKDFTPNEKLFYYTEFAVSIWVLLGLLSLNWYVFVLNTLIGLLLGGWIKERPRWLYKIRAYKNVFVALFVIINGIHLRITAQEAWSWFNSAIS